MKMTKINIRDHLEPLQLLDIEKCTTVGKTVEQMANCAMGARMVGEAAETITGWIEAGKKPRIVMDDYRNSDYLYNSLVESFAGRISSQEYARSASRDPIIVAGYFLDSWKENLFDRGSDEVVFINNFGMAPPWVRDGYFRGFVNGDPRLVLPIITDAVEERISGRPATFEGLFRSWQSCGGVGNQAAHGFETFKQMVQDPDCTVFATISGILTMAQLGGLISYMIDRGWVQAISATGALIGHGFVEDVELKHLKYDPRYNDEQLADQQLNRIGTTVEPEENLDHIEKIYGLILEKGVDREKPISPAQKNYLIGKYLSENYPNGKSILRSAYEKNIPVFIPAPDSELDNDQLIYNWKQKSKGQKEIVTNNEIDALRLVDMVIRSKKQGIFTLGGGVPRNWIQNVMPLIEIMNVRLNLGFPERRFSYGCRICPDPVYLEHLSGCTFDEMKSWRKAAKDGRFSEVKTDYSIVLPFYVAAMKDVIESR